jgi:hypothetical protein
MDLGPATSNNVQLRVGFSYSPLDVYRGFKVMGHGDADCLAFESRALLTRILTDGLDGIEAAAHREQVNYLEANQGQWQALLGKAQKRLDARVITLLEFEDFGRRVEDFEHRLEASKAAVARADARGATSSQHGLLAMERTYVSRQRDLDGIESSLHRLQDWNLRMVGGAIPMLDQRVEWFGWMEASYNFGGLFQRPQENNYLRARQRELQDATYEYPARLEVLRREADAMLNHGRRELALADQHLAFLERIASSMGPKETPTASQEMDLISMERISAVSERLYWSALVTELTAFIGNDQGGTQ